MIRMLRPEGKKVVLHRDFDRHAAKSVARTRPWRFARPRMAVSPTTGLSYAQEYRIRLSSEDRTADLTVRMVREDQEIYIDLRKWDLGETIKYEGLATVTGRLDGNAVEGTAIIEVQPYGHQ